MFRVRHEVFAVPDEPATRFVSDPRPDPSATITRFGSNEQATAVFAGIEQVQSKEAPSIPGYAVQGRLGVGGMGVVYKAVQQPLNRPVALKMIRGTVAPGSRSLVRFLAEAEAAAAISHENVVRVFEYGEVGGEPFMVLEYLPGGTLAERLQESGPIAVATATNWLAAIARGVAAARRLGIVHRDLKPANILFDDREIPKVSDFGLAKLRAGVDVTATQEVMGTPAYMSPEQARGESKFAGPESDVWALRVMLYEAIAGRRPFESDSSWGVIREILSKDPPSLQSRKVPRDLAVVCSKCLAKQPHLRYASAEQLADDLDRVRLGLPVSARPVSVVRRVGTWLRRRPAVTAALVAAIAVLTSVVVLVGKIAAGRSRGSPGGPGGKAADGLPRRSPARRGGDGTVRRGRATESCRRAERSERIACGSAQRCTPPCEARPRGSRIPLGTTANGLCPGPSPVRRRSRRDTATAARKVLAAIARHSRSGAGQNSVRRGPRGSGPRGFDLEDRRSRTR